MSAEVAVVEVCASAMRGATLPKATTLNIARSFVDLSIALFASMAPTTSRFSRRRLEGGTHKYVLLTGCG